MGGRRTTGAALVGTGLLLLAGCRFDGIQAQSLPGTIGTGDDAIVVTVELPDVGTLTTNAQVRVGDVAVGTVTDLQVEDWHAVATLSLEPDVRVRADTTAAVGINSLLGSSYVELVAAPAPGTGGAAGGGSGDVPLLADGDRVPLERGSAYPSTESVLSSASTVLNGGGLAQVATITSELNKAVNGNDLAVADLLPRVDSFVAELDAQRGTIVEAITALDTLSQRFAENRPTIARALEEIGPLLATLSEERPQVVEALTALGELQDVATPLVAATQEDLVGNLSDLAPTLASLAQAGDSLVGALGFAVTFPFAPETVTNACRGDYCNLDLTVDLTTDALADGLVTPGGELALPGIPGSSLLPALPQLGTLLDGVLGGSPPGGAASGLPGLPGSNGLGASPALPPVGADLGGITDLVGLVDLLTNGLGTPAAPTPGAAPAPAPSGAPVTDAPVGGLLDTLLGPLLGGTR
ncbi:MCE family protein [Nocardioides zeae]|uniref:MCE family protein n=1 Tax=Nocardioides zeae TaxID=1457234 RepID=A0A6P0HIY7_9ACTN|nr:MCE family protein [Nocardioides zeae]NEN77595.1 MCE family protein [Nocardioides zeae]